MLRLALGEVSFGLERVVADDPPLARLVVEADLLDAEVVTHRLVAALPRQHGVQHLGEPSRIFSPAIQCPPARRR